MCLVCALSCATPQNAKSPDEPTTHASSKKETRTTIELTEPMVISPGAHRSPSAEAYFAFLASEQHMQKGNIAQAISSLNNALLHDDESAFLYVRLAELKNQSGDREGAIRAIEDALTRDKNQKRALFLKAWFQKSGGDIKRAIATLDDALISHPSDAALAELLAQVHIENNDIDKAESVIVRLMNDKTDRTDGFLRLGALFIEEGDLTRAQSYVERALERDERNSAALQMYTDLHLAKGEYDKAYQAVQTLMNERGDVPWLRRVLLISALLSDNHRAQGKALAGAWLEQDASLSSLLFVSRAYEEAGMRESARELLGKQKVQSKLAQIELGRLFLDDRAYKKAAPILCSIRKEDVPEDYYKWAQSLCAQSLAHTGDFKKAKSLLVKGLEKAPRDSSLLGAILNLARLWPEQKEALQKRVLAVAPKEDDALHDLHARVYLEQGDEKKARVLLLERQKEKPGDARRAMALARHLDRAGFKRDAAKSAIALMEREAPTTDTLNFAAFALAQANVDADDAVVYATRALYKGPLNGYVTDTLGWALYRAKKNDEAKAVLLRANTLSPNEPEILYHLGVVLRALGENNEAKRVLNKARSLCSATDDICQKIDESGAS